MLCSILGSKYVNLTSMDQEGAYPRGELYGRLPLTDGRGTVLKAIHSGLIVGHIHHWRSGRLPLDLKAINSRVRREQFVFELKRLLSFVLVGPG